MNDPLLRRIEFERLFGLEEVYVSRGRRNLEAADAAAEPQEAVAPPSEEPGMPSKKPRKIVPEIESFDGAGGDRARALLGLREEMCACSKCPLSKTRTNVVFGEGSAEARLVFVGEAPGAQEDETGRPFVGRAGQLLTRMIEAMGLRREDVFICNVLKCRPPGNRPPATSEIAACSPNLLRQIEVIRPRVICALGGPAAKTLLDTNEGITKIRGRFHDYHGTRLMPTFHPAYLLRNPPEKAKVWEDLKQVMALLAEGPEDRPTP